MKRLFQFSLFLLLLALLASCATQKRKTARKGISKAYNNVTARNNGYFNAKVLLTESIAKLEEQHQDNYNKLLPVYPYLAAPNPQEVAGQLDDAIKKVSVVVTLHRGSHWDDDCYLLLAKSQFLKQDYEDAENSFNYAVEQFNPEAMAARAAEAEKKGKKKRRKGPSSKKKKKKKKRASSSKKKKSPASKKKKKKTKAQLKKEYYARKAKEEEAKKKGEKIVDQPKAGSEEAAKSKKEDQPKAITVSNLEKDLEKPDKYILKHRPAYQEIRLWQALNLLERDDYDQASSIMSELESDSKTFKYIRRDLAAARAHFNIKQKRYDEAIPHLEKAIALEDEKEKRSRYAYIIAQIHQEAGRTDAAFAAYDLALKYSSSYDMEFSSRLNLAQSAWKKGQATPEQVLKDLNKMLKDIKNEEYQDQIYFVMADIALSINDQENAIEYLTQSIDLNTNNEPQKIESNYKLAMLYFEREEYIEAEKYFSSTLSLMPNTDERYPVVKSYKENLKDIAENLKTIKLQDSLLTLSAFSDEEKLALASKIKKGQEEERINKLKEQSLKAANIKRASNSRRTNSTASTFFAYDDKKVRRGKKDFNRKWGDRPLRDNWRRSSSKESQEGNIDELAEETSLQLTMEEVKKILGNIPDSPQAKDAANKQIESALHQLGILYRDRLENPAKSIATFEDLLRRYPNTEHRLEAWYYLYLAHTELGEQSKADQYKDLIVKNYSKSKYARALVDPDFLNANKEEERKLILYYNEAYSFYDNSEYEKAYELAIKADSIFGPTNELKPKFALLTAICTGSTKGKQAYIDALKVVVAKYPDSPEQIRANEILRLLGGATKSDKNLAKSNFRLNDKSSHYLMIVLDKASVKTEEAKIAVSNYNLANHKLDRIKITTITLGDNLEQPVLVLRRFKNRDEAMKYFNGVQKNKEKFMPARAKYELYPITQSNYRQILRAKKLDGYATFFEDNYLD